MPFVTRKSLLSLTLLLLAAIMAAGLFVWSGIYNIGADDTHTKPVYAVLQALRQKSIAHHARGLEVPDLTDAGLIRSGAGNYDAMCTGCHLAPGSAETELSKGLYPVPPNFSKLTPNDPAHDFWVIKHGIKASGMPAWGKSMEDQYIWGMVAFLQQMPKLDANQYRALVATSGGHSHGGGETSGHHHEGGEAGNHHDEEDGHNEEKAMDAHMHKGEPGNASGKQAAVSTPAGTTHVHADGKTHLHAAPQTQNAAVPPSSSSGPAGADEPAAAPQAPVKPASHDDGHTHQH